MNIWRGSESEVFEMTDEPDRRRWLVLAEFDDEAAAEAYQSLADGLEGPLVPLDRPVILETESTFPLFLDATTSIWLWRAMELASVSAGDKFDALMEEMEEWLDAANPGWRTVRLED